jgi:hypothetical protein
MTRRGDETSPENPHEALHEASADRNHEQYSAVHLLAGRKLGEAAMAWVDTMTLTFGVSSGIREVCQTDRLRWLKEPYPFLATHPFE